MSSRIKNQPLSEAAIASSMTALRSSGIVSADWNSVGTYLEKHADLAPWLPKICTQARRDFGPEPQLALELYRDPEIEDSFLTLYIRQSHYDLGIMDRIDSLNRQFDSALEQVSGYFLIATDFRRPQHSHGV
jgi:hypothetical protein